MSLLSDSEVTFAPYVTGGLTTAGEPRHGAGLISVKDDWGTVFADV